MANHQSTPDSWDPPYPDHTQVLPPPGPVMPPTRPPLSTAAVIGFVLAFLLAPVGLAISLFALGRTGAGAQRGRGLAVAGTVIGGLFTVFLMIGTVNSIAEDARLAAAPAPDAPAAPPPATPPAPPAAVASPGLGTVVEDGEFTFTVTDARWIGRTVENGVFEQQAQGEFYLLTVDVTNIGDEARDLAHGYQKIYDTQGRQYSATDAWLALPNADRSILAKINPGNTVTGAPLLFDLPSGTDIDRIELHDTWYSDGVSVAIR